MFDCKPYLTCRPLHSASCWWGISLSLFAVFVACCWMEIWLCKSAPRLVNMPPLTQATYCLSVNSQRVRKRPSHKQVRLHVMEIHLMLTWGKKPTSVRVNTQVQGNRTGWVNMALWVFGVFSEERLKANNKKIDYQSYFRASDKCLHVPIRSLIISVCIRPSDFKWTAITRLTPKSFQFIKILKLIINGEWKHALKPLCAPLSISQ